MAFTVQRCTNKNSLIPLLNLVGINLPSLSCFLLVRDLELLRDIIDSASESGTLSLLLLN